MVLVEQRHHQTTMQVPVALVVVVLAGTLLAGLVQQVQEVKEILAVTAQQVLVQMPPTVVVEEVVLVP
jgi:hypothetical protein